MRTVLRSLVVSAAVMVGSTVPGVGQPVTEMSSSISADGIKALCGTGTLEISAIADNVVRIHVYRTGKPSERTAVIDPHLSATMGLQVTVRRDGEADVLQTSKLKLTVMRRVPATITVSDVNGHELLRQMNPFVEAEEHTAAFVHDVRENLYGMRGLDIRDNSGSLLRNNGATVKSGEQGDGGAPWFFTTRYGVLIDSDGGSFRTRDNVVMLNAISRDDLEYFIMVGPPMETMAGLAKVSGRPPLPPKWTLGLLNSQWGSSEKEVKDIVATYRTKKIPLDGFILDFDWKAWGEDNYGEWRWNGTSGPGNSHPNLFPNGASGAFAKELARSGVRLGGILKPRILLNKPSNGAELMDAAAYAEAHHLWHSNEPAIIDYVTGRPARDLDFTKAETRSWFWKHLEPAFDTGMVAWWNDEADITDVERGHFFEYTNLQFLNMGRMLYDGQRSHSDLRVWSLNRSYYAGAQRYGYALWSGDIETGFGSMMRQRARMIASLNIGEPHWSMDAGGFNGTPSPENYARWVEFAAFVPIDRVHGTLGEKRQPWLYGPVAEAAAVKAIHLRYALLPYIYSYEHTGAETGLGVVRPLFWMFPDDPKLADDSTAWMFGDALLVSPVVTAGEAEHSVYLPQGAWFDYATGARLDGGRTINVRTNTKTWDDIPLFVRSGSILATQAPQNFIGEKPVEEVMLDVFADTKPARFAYYDDDGETYAYEHGAFYRQTVTAVVDRGIVRIAITAPEGSFRPALRWYVVRVHGISAAKPGWKTGRDRFGAFTEIRVAAGQPVQLVVK
jgi:Alpha-glucosidases, family 31 of glycosyl hydrolases